MINLIKPGTLSAMAAFLLVSCGMFSDTEEKESEHGIHRVLGEGSIFTSYRGQLGNEVKCGQDELALAIDAVEPNDCEHPSE